MDYLIAVFIGILLGVFLTLLFVGFSKCGVLRVCIPDDPEEPPYLFADLDVSVDTICEKSTVIFKVDIRNINSHQ